MISNNILATTGETEITCFRPGHRRQNEDDGGENVSKQGGKGIYIVANEFVEHHALAIERAKRAPETLKMKDDTLGPSDVNASTGKRRIEGLRQPQLTADQKSTCTGHELPARRRGRASPAQRESIRSIAREKRKGAVDLNRRVCFSPEQTFQNQTEA